MLVSHPPTAQVILSGTVFSAPATAPEVLSVERTPGASIGTAVVEYPRQYAVNFQPQMGKTAKILFNGTCIFSGFVDTTPVEIDTSRDRVRLVLTDDKKLMDGQFLGQGGIGTLVGGGFTDVGYEVVFNANGQKNKNATSLDFDLSSSAVYWTCKDILAFIFTYYVPATIASYVAPTESGWACVPANLNLFGSSALEAVQHVADLAGVSWTLAPQKTGASKFQSISPETGTVKNVLLFKPLGWALSAGATSNHAGVITINPSIRDSVDAFEAISGPALLETTIGSSAAYGNTLKRDTGWVSEAPYVARWKMDVTKYTSRLLGINRAATSAAKRWMNGLCTRVDREGGAIVAIPCEAPRFPRYKGPIVWLVLDNAKTPPVVVHVLAGFRIDYEAATIDFESKIEIASSKAKDKKTTLVVPDSAWAIMDCYLTVATQIETRQTYKTTDPSYLPIVRTKPIVRSDLVPEFRYKSVIPDPGSASGYTVLSNVSAPELVYDTTDRLTDSANAALATTPKIERTADITFDFFPSIVPGDRVQLVGRPLPMPDPMSVYDCRYSFVHGKLSKLAMRCSNVAVRCNPGNYIRRRGSK